MATTQKEVRSTLKVTRDGKTEEFPCANRKVTYDENGRITATYNKDSRVYTSYGQNDTVSLGS